MNTAQAQPSTTILTVPTDSLACCCCRDLVEERLRQQPGVVSAHVDLEHQVAQVQVRDGGPTAAELAELVACACGERNPVPLPPPQFSSHAHAHTASVAPADHAAMGQPMPAEQGGTAFVLQGYADH